MNKILYKSGLYLKRHSPTILTFIGAVGVVATAVMAVKATPKAARLIRTDSMRNHNGEPHAYTKLEAVKSSWKCYIPAALIGVSTISCIFGANVLNKHRQASLASAYALLNQSYQRYRKAANSVYGEDADSKIKVQAAKEIYVSADGGYIYHPDLDNTSEKVLFYDSYSERYFTSTMASVLNAEYHLNRNLNLRGEVSVNEFYCFLGMDDVNGGHEIGWSFDELAESGFTWLDFRNDFVKLDDGMECYIVSALFEPTVLYYEN